MPYPRPKTEGVGYSLQGDCKVRSVGYSGCSRRCRCMGVGVVGGAPFRAKLVHVRCCCVRPRTTPHPTHSHDRYNVFDAMLDDKVFCDAYDIPGAYDVLKSKDWVRQAVSDIWEDIKIKCAEASLVLSPNGISGSEVSSFWEKNIARRKRFWEAQPNRQLEIKPW